MEQNIEHYMTQIGRGARAASRELARADTRSKNNALYAMAEAIERDRSKLLDANGDDVTAAMAEGLAPAMVDRLRMTDASINNMIEGLMQIAALPDPVGEITDLALRPSGIQVGKMRVPLGVIGIIYEARPNVTADAAALCLKSGNATILRGGSEAIRSNRAIASCVQEGLLRARLPATAVQVVNTTDRAAVGQLITLSEFVDVIVPRGGKGLIERLMRESSIPMIKHLDGNCHVFIDSHADMEKAVNIAVNAKTQRFAPCNTMETLLVHEVLAPVLLPKLAKIYQEKHVELRVCPRAMNILDAFDVKEASEDDWFTEYAAPILAIKVVSDLDHAIEHINHYGSHHTDAIVTEDYAHARRFLREVDSSSVMVNASTRFADGFEYGLGAEIGISTDKIHARGPVGLHGLTSQKFVVLGSGEVRG